ncbi:MAG: hypothetical protein HOV92_37225 [Streptomyces sp.]|nr:hypothetical protein [Streptomyces sp.]
MPRKSVRDPGGTTDTTRERALRPVEAGSGLLVHTTSDRRLATEHWLLSTLPEAGRDRARTEWQKCGAALLPLGTLFSAVRIPGRLIVSLLRTDDPERTDEFLDDALDSGPVICDPHGPRYYALVPASMPATWREAAAEWRALDVDCLGRDTYLGVPAVDAVTYDPAFHSYWSVPMSSAATLCAPLAVARLIAAAKPRLTQEAER